jgi:GH15 family glucan-1,4-alpha-glucosidase
MAEAVQWLEGEAHRIIRSSAVPMRDGTMAFPPQVGIGYAAFWLRDYEYALEGSSQSLSSKELTDACRVFVKALRKDGAAVDCVGFDGTPIYKPGYGSMGREPVLDGPPFTVSVVWQTYHRIRDKALLEESLEPLIKTMNYMPRNPSNGLAHINFRGERCPYGFTDTIEKSGDELFCSLLMVQASRQLGELLEAGGRMEEVQKWRKEADRMAASVRGVFWDDQTGLFRSTTGACNVPDIWGSAFAVWLRVATKEQTRRVAGYFKEHYGELVLHGQVRHTPGFMDWNGNKTATDSGNYQSGGFWATPTGWFAYTLDQADSALADKTVIEMVRHFQEHGACEWVNREGKGQLPGYTASAALPLAGIRTMLESRNHASSVGN